MAVYLHLGQNLAFALGGLDPSYADLREFFSDLDGRYPIAGFQGVKLYDKPGDRSLGFSQGRLIHLNRFWFGQPRQLLEDAAFEGRLHRVQGIAPWHDGMPEPVHTFVHEFGHVLADALTGNPDFESLVESGFDLARRRPSLAATGYSLKSSPEWWAETFACADLGTAEDNQQVATVRAFLDRLKKTHGRSDPAAAAAAKGPAARRSHFRGTAA